MAFLQKSTALNGITIVVIFVFLRFSTVPTHNQHRNC